MKRMLAAWVILVGLGACGNPSTCDRFCEARLECSGKTEAISACVECCEQTIVDRGKDGQTDCAAIWETAATCIEAGSCDDLRDRCAAELDATDFCS